MKNTFLVVLTAAVLAAPASVATVAAGQKSLPPAFGKELVPEQESQEYKGPNGEAEERMEEEKEERATDRPPARHHAGGGAGQHHGGRVRIQLDGDEDGGGEDLGGDD